MEIAPFGVCGFDLFPHVSTLLRLWCGFELSTDPVLGLFFRGAWYMADDVNIYIHINLLHLLQ